MLPAAAAPGAPSATKTPAELWAQPELAARARAAAERRVSDLSPESLGRARARLEAALAERTAASRDDPHGRLRALLGGSAGAQWPDDVLGLPAHGLLWEVQAAEAEAARRVVGEECAFPAAVEAAAHAGVLRACAAAAHSDALRRCVELLEALRSDGLLSAISPPCSAATGVGGRGLDEDGRRQRPTTTQGGGAQQWHWRLWAALVCVGRCGEIGAVAVDASEAGAAAEARLAEARGRAEKAYEAVLENVRKGAAAAAPAAVAGSGGGAGAAGGEHAPRWR